MHKVINGKRYNTETAKKVAEWTNAYDVLGDLDAVWETLYKKRTGEYFIHGLGGPRTEYSVTIADNEWAGGEKIIPLTLEEAMAWAKAHNRSL